MKKVFAIALIAVSFAACNNSGDKKSDSDTTTKVSGGDTITTVTNTDTTVHEPGDTTIKKTVDTDTTHK
jgi:ABC-type Fe3+-hydroxamate transport system substrate-binding protein